MTSHTVFPYISHFFVSRLPVSWRWRTRTRSTYFSNKLAAPAKTPHHLDPTLIYFIPHVSFRCFHIVSPSLSLFASLLPSLAFLELGITNVFPVFIYAMVRQLLWWGNKLKKAARGPSSSNCPQAPLATSAGFYVAQNTDSLDKPSERSQQGTAP